VNSFTQDRGGLERNFYFLPPQALVAPTLRHVRACRARMTLVVLGWRSAPWWPLLSSSVAFGRGFAPFVKQQLYCPAGREVLVHGRASRDRFFGKGVPILDVFALDIDFSCQVSLIPPLTLSNFVSFQPLFLQIGSTSKAGTSMRPVFHQLTRNSPAFLSILTTPRFSAAIVVHVLDLLWPLETLNKQWCLEKGVPALPSSPLTVALYMMRLLCTARTPSPLLTFFGADFHSLAGLP
jgi:hypothetical protein